MDPKIVRKTLEERDQKNREENMRLWQQAAEDAGRLVQLLSVKYQPTRIWQWGSVLHPEQFRKGSDIDIAVEGIPNAETWFQLLGDVMESQTQFPVDVVQMEKIEPEYAEIIRLKGKVVYER